MCVLQGIVCSAWNCVFCKELCVLHGVFSGCLHWLSELQNCCEQLLGNFYFCHRSQGNIRENKKNFEKVREFPTL